MEKMVMKHDKQIKDERKTLLILGANGFIGRNLKEYFERNKKDYVIVTPSRRELDLTDGIAVERYLRSQYFDVIINAAIYSLKSPDTDTNKELENDLRMFYNLEKHKGLFGKMLYFGSGAEYNKAYDIHMVEENKEIEAIPDSSYGFAKYIINKSIEKADNIYCLRIFGLYGKYENWKSTFISGACCKAIKNLPITIRQNVVFDYMYIKDFCQIVQWFVENKPLYHTYNLTTGMPIDLVTLANTILKVCKKDLPVYICRDGLAKEYTASNKRLLNEIGSFRFMSHENAIEDLYKWYQDNENIIDMYSLLYQ